MSQVQTTCLHYTPVNIFLRYTSEKITLILKFESSPWIKLLNHHDSFGWQPVLSQKHIFNWIWNGCLIWTEEDNDVKWCFQTEMLSVLSGRSVLSIWRPLVTEVMRTEGGEGGRRGEGQMTRLPTQNTALLSIECVCVCVCHRRDISSFFDNLIV